MGEDARFNPYRALPWWRSGSGRSDGRKAGRECARVCGYGRCGGKCYRRFAEYANLPFHKTFEIYLTSARNRMAVCLPTHPSFPPSSYLLQKLTYPSQHPLENNPKPSFSPRLRPRPPLRRNTVRIIRRFLPPTSLALAHRPGKDAAILARLVRGTQ